LATKANWQIIEALLFSHPSSLTIAQIKKITGIQDTREIRVLLDELNQFYQKHDRAFRVYHVAGGFQLRTISHFQEWIRKADAIKPTKLSPSVLETLAIVAYQQPITRAEIEAIRTVDCSYSIRSLLDRNLIKITGRSDVLGRPMLYGTTKYFLEIFSLKKLDDLPRLEDFDLEQIEEAQEE
jgi:segregation and condensation protein B